jgi:hypothetical protein
MPSKNPNTPTRARATKSTTAARPAAPRRRATTRTAAPAETAPETVAEAQASAAAVAAPAASSVDYAEYVRTRAYYLHLERKGRPGNPVEDWLAAEREFGSGAGGNA